MVRLFAFLALLAGALLSAAELRWTHLSSDDYDLPVPFAGPEPTASLLVDVDNDGAEDIVVAARRAAPAVVLYRREKSVWKRYVIDPSFQTIEAGGAHYDIDGDGDRDIVFAGDSQSNRIYWWENPYPDFDPAKPWTRRLIKDSGANKHHDQIFGDFDGDGRADLVSWNQGARQLLLFKIPAEPKSVQPWPSSVIYSWSEGDEHEGLAAADINLDGKLDIVGGGRWFEHKGGTSFEPHVVDDAYRFSRALAGQFVKGGRPEIVFGPGDNVLRLRLYQWTGSRWDGKDLLPYDVNHGHSLRMGDLDRDGNLDIFCAEMAQWTNRVDNPNARMYALYGNGKGNFNVQIVQQGQGSHESRLGDLDGDGDLDIFAKAYRHNAPRLDVWRNDGPRKGPLSLDRWRRHVIDADKPWRAVWIRAADLDGDGRKDIATGGWWYKNPGRAAGRWVRSDIGAPLKNLSVIYDFDMNGTYDILGSPAEGSDADPAFVLALNDGRGVFRVVDTPGKAEGDFLQGVVVGRLETQAEVQVAMSWHRANQGVQLFTPAADKWAWRRISDFSQDEDLSAGDIDRDGDRDLLLGTRWLRNDGNGAWSLHTVNPVAGDPDRNRLADINGDGRLDAVVGFEAINIPGKLAWYEQPASLDDAWPEHVIAEVVGPMSLSVADMDGDGDLDVAVGEHNYKAPATAKLIVFENLDGKGGQWRPHVVYTGDEHHDGAIIVDIDGDGDRDIISIGWSHPRVLLYENLAIR
ncbi:MAG: VCBS repeat-containing protein [Bryobacteraceae bacterium]|nr:VCBS repeat-containing protein [Bryobacteraceae bacterium]